MAELKQYAAEPMAEVPEMKELIDKKMKEMAELKPCEVEAISNAIKKANDFAKKNLKPCPFCGEDEGLRFYSLENEVCVYCLDCESYGPMEFTEQQAIDAWNKRS